MKKFEGLLLCTDVDGTLADRSGKAVISRENIEAVNYFMEQGGLFTLATGRQRKFTKQFDEMFICNAPMILINGTVVVDSMGMPIYSKTLPEEAMGDIFSIYKGISGIKESHIRSIDGQIKYLFDEGRYSMAENSLPPWYKCIFLFDKEEDCSNSTEKMIKEFGTKYEFDRSWPIEVEMHGKGSGKGDAVRFLRRFYGEKVQKVICVGDYENDISMLLEADEGIAVSNAIDSVKAAADRITVSCDESAIARIIGEL